MRKETAYDFWKRYLRLVHNRWSRQTVENPLRGFSTRVRAGEYNSVSDEEFSRVYKDYQELDAIWKHEAQHSAGEILLDALEMTEISDEAIDHIADYLAGLSASSDYLPKADVSWRRAPETPFDDSSSDADGSDRASLLEDLDPQTIFDSLCERVHGQDEAKRAAAMILFNHLRGFRSSAVFCGPSGCGKSEIWRCLSREYPGLVRIMDASRLSADGWKGSLHLRDIFDGVPASSVKAQGLIVVLDEADKVCCESAVGSSGTNFNHLIQNNLLKMMDGDVIEFGEEDRKPAFSVDCSHVSVVLLGAFENLLQGKSCGGGIGFGAAPRIECDYTNTDISYSDLIGAGMRREIAGRINRIVPLRPLSAADYKEILTGFVLNELQSAGNYTVTIDDEVADRLSSQAASSGLGVRWMLSQIMNALDDLTFLDPHADHYNISAPSGAGC